MSRLHELVFRIDGVLSNNTKRNFADMNKSISGMADRLKKLEKINFKTEKYEALKKKIDITKNSLYKATQESNKFRTEFEKSKETTNALKNSWSEAQQKADELAMAIAKSTSPTKEMRSAFSVAKLEAKKAKEEFKNSAKATAGLEHNYKTANSTVKVLNGNLERETNNLQNLKKELEGAGFSSNNFAEKQEQLAKKLEKAQKIQSLKTKANNSWQDTSQKGKGLLKSGAKYGAALTVPLKFAIDSETTMADIGKVVDFDSIAERTQFEQKMRQKLGKELPMSFKDYGELIGNAAGAGIKKSELLNFSEDAAKMSVAFDIEAGEAGEKMAKWRSAFRMNQEEVMQLADKINYLSNNSAATAPAISNIVSRVGALGGVAGMTSGDVAAIGTSMVSMGVGEEVGATAIKKMATSLTKGSAATKSQQAVFERLGLSANQVAKNMQKDAQGTILQVLEGIKKLPKEAQATNLTQLFGEESVQAIAPLLGNLELLKTQFENVDESAGKFKNSMQEEFNIRSDTAANKLQLLKNNMNNLTTIVGQALLPTFVNITGRLVDMTQKISEFAKDNPKLVSGLVKVAVGLGGIVVASKGILFINSLLHSLRLSAKLLYTVISANPVLLVIGGIIAALLVLYKNWDKVKNYITKGIELIHNKFEWFKNTVVNIFGKILSAGIKAGKGIKKFFWDAIMWIPNKLSKIKDSIKNIGGKSKSLVNGKNHINGYAKGGIITSPELAMVGEGGSHEAIIPLDGSNNAYKLWQYAGQRLGAIANASPGSISITPYKGGTTIVREDSGQTYVINLTINVDADGDTELERKLENALLKASPRLRTMIKKMIDDIRNDKRRLSYDY